MTKEEAIEIILYNLLDRGGCDSFDKQDKEALLMAVEALEQQPCEDCISREAVIRLVEQYPNIIGNRCIGLISDIKHLPSVTPITKSEEAIHAPGFVEGVKACIEKLNEMGG